VFDTKATLLKLALAGKLKPGAEAGRERICTEIRAIERVIAQKKAEMRRK